MDKLNRYHQLIQKILQHHEILANKAPEEPIEAHVICDYERHRYMLFDTGWWNKKRVRKPTIYIRICNGKIWIEEDWTEDGIATDLLAAGVPKEDIVLAFHHPDMRPLTEFAV